MSVAEKLAGLTYKRIETIHASLEAKDWIDGAWYDEAQCITMDEWAGLVKRELKRRSHRRKAA